MAFLNRQVASAARPEGGGSRLRRGDLRLAVLDARLAPILRLVRLLHFRVGAERARLEAHSLSLPPVVAHFARFFLDASLCPQAVLVGGLLPVAVEIALVLEVDRSLIMVIQ